jgi:D-serine dehydratase
MGNLLLKMDNELPISGSIKARSGIYEVPAHAENLALQGGLLTLSDDYRDLASESCRKFFSQYRIAVGSTGNLGLSIGMMGTQLGFQVTVHMSADAKPWKKALLRSRGVEVIEYASDYSQAVAQGRRQAVADPQCHFVDDENSTILFIGYAVAAVRLRQQLEDLSIAVDAQHPLFVYLPCGVGGAPGGLSFDLKLTFGDHVHCLFAEPTHAPCMLLGVHTGLHESVSVQDFDIDNATAADGLAVGRPSGFVGRAMQRLITGFYTIDDDGLYALLALMVDHEQVSLEPSAVAGIPGIARLQQQPWPFQLHDSSEARANATHIAWATGGRMVPEDVMAEDYRP